MRHRTPSPEYRSWMHMKTRCLNPRHIAYHRYGGRGIKICKRWLEGFENFLADLGPRPSSKHTLDRIDNDGDYEPSNVRWGTLAEQNNNRSDNRLISFQGKTQTLAEWSRALGVNKSALGNRLRAGWSIERTLTTARVHGWKDRLEHGGKSLTYEEWSRASGLSVAAIWRRIHISGMSIEKALSLPKYYRQRGLAWEALMPARILALSE